jgi:hypothetical protein
MAESVLIVSFLFAPTFGPGQTERTALRQVVDLNVGDSREVELHMAKKLKSSCST